MNGFTVIVIEVEHKSTPYKKDRKRAFLMSARLFYVVSPVVFNKLAAPPGPALRSIFTTNIQHPTSLKTTGTGLNLEIEKHPSNGLHNAGKAKPEQTGYSSELFTSYYNKRSACRKD